MTREDENARRLITALREIPEGEKSVYHVPGDGEFVWSFNYELIDRAEIELFKDFVPQNYCGSLGCAKGLAKLLGITESLHTEEVGKAIGINDIDIAYNIFMNGATYGVVPESVGLDWLGVRDAWNKVTPAMVADKIEEAKGWK